MSNLHRIKWIDDCVRRKKFPNCQTIADEFEISTRQALRDIEYLKYSLDAPVEYSAEKKGYYYSDNYYTIPAGFISKEEKNTLSYLAYRYRNLGSENALKIAELFDKLTDSKNRPDEKGDSRDIFYVKASQISNYDPVNHAIENCLKIKVQYVNAKEEISKRILHPYKLFVSNNNDYLEAFCEQKNCMRIFRLDKIKLQEVTKDTFVKTETSTSQYDQKTGSFQFRSPYKCRLKFKDPFNRMMNNPDFKSLGDDIFEISYYSSDDLIKNLLSINSTFTIIHPAWLKNRLLKVLTQILNENK